jgi:hypothetical protein
MEIKVESNSKPNPIQILYPTPIYLGYLDVDLNKLENLSEWARTQKWQDVGDTPLFTTRGGQQFITDKLIFDYDHAPAVKDLKSQIQTALDTWLAEMTGQTCYTATITGSQFVFYNQGGHQWPHWHASTWTAILGLRSRGTVLIQDPRPLATFNSPLYREIIVNPGQLFISPGYLIHSSTPAYEDRDILVLTGN